MNNNSILFMNTPGDFATDKVLEFGKLNVGWHFGDGDKFDENVVIRACSAIKKLKILGFKIIDAFPIIDGTIELTVYSNENKLSIHVKENGFAIVAESIGTNLDLGEFSDIPENEIFEYLVKANNLWGTSAFYLKTIGTSNPIVFPDLPSTIHQKVGGEEFQLLTSSAQIQTSQACAST